MQTQPLYCHKCKKLYNVRQNDLEMMKENDPNFDDKGYTGGCFFKKLSILKQTLSKNQKE
jgi:hypothetical protein